MYKARIGIYYDTVMGDLSTRYLMTPDVREITALKINDDYMIDIETNTIYPIVKHDKRGYLDGDIELNKEYIISYEPAKVSEYNNHLKVTKARIIAALYRTIYISYLRDEKIIEKGFEKKEEKLNKTLTKTRD